MGVQWQGMKKTRENNGSECGRLHREELCREYHSFEKIKKTMIERCTQSYTNAENKDETKYYKASANIETGMTVLVSFSPHETWCQRTS